MYHNNSNHGIITQLTKSSTERERLPKHSGPHIFEMCCCSNRWRNRTSGMKEKQFLFRRGFILLLIFISTDPSSGLNNDILRLNIPTEPPLDPNIVCKNYPALSDSQYAICAKYPDVTASAIQGIQVAIHECQHQMSGERWNCSSLEKKNKNPHSSAILRRGYKETAFAYAISAAGVTHQVSKACSLGKLRSCGCDMRVHGKGRKWDWGGCSHNVIFGEKFAAKFTDIKERARDVHAKINLHNNRVGRKVVLEHVANKCKCHGMSGSCELKTCWKVTPNFRDVGDILKKKLNAANRIRLSNKVRGRKGLRKFRRHRKKQLIFYERSPNFCSRDTRIDSPGTTGRFCNTTSRDRQSCDSMCCGRGYDTLRVHRTERCNCKFHWCCFVRCERCVYDDWVTVCK